MSYINVLYYKNLPVRYKNILKYVGLFGGLQGLNILMGLVRSKITAVLIGPMGVGFSSLMNTVVSFLSNATNFGISFSAVKGISEYGKEDAERQNRAIAVVRTWSLIAAALGFCVTVIGAPLINQFTFSWGNHTLHYLMLAPVVALAALTGGETAILKGTRRMRSLALVQFNIVLLSIIITIPIYYYWGVRGIVPVLNICALAAFLITIHYSFRYYPYRISHIREYIKEGVPMVRLGLAFIVAGIVGSGVEVYIRVFLNMLGDLDTVGLYYAAFTMAITYPSTLLNSLENDYFSRLSAVCNQKDEMRNTVNAQIEVLLMVMVPVIALLLITLPIVVPLLFSSKFIDSIPMAQATLLAMFIRTVTLPAEYIVLAKGKAKMYCCLETLWGVLTIVFLTIGYNYNGLLGMGFGWVAEYIAELVIVFGYFYCKWDYLPSRKAVAFFLLGAVLLTGIYIWCA